MLDSANCIVIFDQTRELNNDNQPSVTFNSVSNRDGHNSPHLVRKKEGIERTRVGFSIRVLTVSFFFYWESENKYPPDIFIVLV